MTVYGDTFEKAWLACKKHYYLDYKESDVLQIRHLERIELILKENIPDGWV
jgi:hypothetical protein